MDIQKTIGYALSIVGIAGIALSSGNIKDTIPLIKALPSSGLLIGGAIAVAAGIALVVIAGKKGIKSKQMEEVPIYKGRGKNRTIVGYQRH